MKTKLFIAVLMITAISLAQSKRGQHSNPKQNTNEIYVKIGEIKGKTNENNSKRSIKIGGTEKPYARTSRSDNNSNKSTNRWWVNHKMKEAELEHSTQRRTKGETTLGDIKILNQQVNRRRVVVAKSNKQGDPNSN